jgi:lipopolysaccharide/colanic/teichoic acid biosynthesis glycosyltransferase
MELAIPAPSLQAAQSVVLGDVKQKVSVFTRQIIRIENPVSIQDKDYVQENTYFTTATVAHSINLINQHADGTIDAILIHPDQISSDITALKEAAKSKAIPLFVYTPKFDQLAKEKALRIGADDYHYGAIASGFYKRIEFVKKLKAYKIERGEKAYSAHSVAEVPQIKIWTLKRAFDILVSATALLLLSPLLLLIALIIKLESRGPIFYISKRAGTGYQIFNFYKFRSMRVGADKELKNLSHLNQYAASSPSANGVFFKIKDDPRITKFGHFIRKTSLDEIPQLFNVLIGDMSLVGNRPLPLYEAEKLTKDQIAWRFLAPAGITGLWQITKRGKDDMSEEERIALDMEYAMKNSFWLDLKIMFKTIPALLQKEKV